MITIFTLASGRSGTRFLSGLLRRNVVGIVSQHEPYLSLSNSTMFGVSIYHHQCGNLEPIRELVRRKQQQIDKYRAQVYLETSHAFLKSYADLAIQYFPRLKLIHLIRNPLKTARSLANRERLTHKFRVPFRTYRADDGRRYFRWSLTGKESIYGHFEPNELSLFQKYVVEWIEIENRAMRLLDRHAKHQDCFTLASPRDLCAQERIAELIRFFGLRQTHHEITIAGNQNRNPGMPTTVDRQHREEFRRVVERLPTEYFDVFQREPYAGFDWIDLLRK